MAQIVLNDLLKAFEQNTAINHVSLTIEDGTFQVLLGPSGCGKTTTLRCIAGLEKTDGGQIFIGDQDVTRLSPAERDIAMVFQQYAIYPHMTVAENMAFPLRAVKTPQSEINVRVEEAARKLRIEKLLNRKPGKLSGGEMQRVAIGRAIVRRPQVFLMDEPLSNLDANMRAEMRTEIKRLQVELGVTTVFVTHDQLEAMSMADKIAVMYGGIIQQNGSPADVYDRPFNLFVAGFIGSPSMNFVSCILSDDGNTLMLEGEIPIGIQVAAKERIRRVQTGKQLILGVRPEDISLRKDNPPEFEPCEVYVMEPLGAENILDVRLGNHSFKVRTPPTFSAPIGARLSMRIDQCRMHLFDAETTLNLTNPVRLMEI